MADFSASWLALREPADTGARSARLAQRLADWLAGPPLAAPQSRAPLGVLDLGAGTGANLRYLAPRLGRDQRWVCVDRDRHLLAGLPLQTTSWAHAAGIAVSNRGGGLRIQAREHDWRVETLNLDLAEGAAALPITRGTLVTASALFDLVSDSWLVGLLQTCARSGSPLLAALTYDGRVEMEPPEPIDGLVVGLVNGHQRRDKGLGPALGPSACSRLVNGAPGLGFAVESAGSDWTLEPDQPGLQEALVSGWVHAAGEQIREVPGASTEATLRRLSTIEQWSRARLGHIAAGRSRIRVGHLDVLLLPGGSGGVGQEPMADRLPTRN